MSVAAFAVVSLRHHIAGRGMVAARLVFYLLLLLMISRLWIAVGDRAGSPADFLWYLAVTELVALGVPYLSLEMEEEVRKGDVAARLIRPVSYLGSRLAEATGEMIARLVGLLTLGFLGAWVFAGRLPSDPRGLVAAIPLVLLATFLALLLQGAVGLSAFWLHEAAPIHWVVQKLLFVFGGLLFPLEIYPGWLRTLAMWTPFAAMIHGPARLVFGFEWSLFCWTLLRLIFWGAGISAFVWWLNRRALRSLEVHGG